MGNIEVFLNEVFTGIMLGCFILFVGLIVLSQEAQRNSKDERPSEESDQDRTEEDSRR